RRHQALGKKSATRASHGAIDGAQQASVTVSRERSCQFKARPSRRVNKKALTIFVPLRTSKWRTLCLLRLLHIGYCTGNGRQFRARKQPEPVKGRDLIKAREPVHGSC